MDAWIETFTGGRFDFINPSMDSIKAADVAHALGNVCRFSGHVKQFYSVAEHSVHVSRMLSGNAAMVGLLHDGSEAYMADVPMPLKRLLPAYEVIEAEVQGQVYRQLGGFAPDVDQLRMVHVADMTALKTEANALLVGRGETWIHDIDGDIGAFEPKCWSPKDAAYEWLSLWLSINGVF